MARATRRTVNAASNLGADGIGNSTADGSDGNASGNIGADGYITIDPGAIEQPASGSDNGSATSATGDAGPKRRGRKPGSTTRAKQATLDVNGIEQLLLSTHYMLAGMTRVQEIALSPDEAKSLAQATANVARHYDVSVSAKALDWTNLIMALGMVYGTRVVAMRNRARSAKANRAKPVNEPRPMEVTPDGVDISTYVPGAA